MNTLTPRPCLDLAGVDWQAAWEQVDAGRGEPPTAEHWDKRASSYTQSHGRDGADYAQAFLACAGIKPGERVLDFGCGDGLLSIPLVQAGCTVVACDFSQGMLDNLMRRAEEAGVTDLIEPHHVAWNDDWQVAGLAPNCVDVAVASRSLVSVQLESALRKLETVARRRVCITVAAGASPRRDIRAYEAVGRTPFWTPDYAYCINVLFAHGVFPELSYITTRSRPGFASREAAVAELARMLGNNLTPEETARLEAFVAAHYAPNPERDADHLFESDADRVTRWALISWDAASMI